MKDTHSLLFLSYSVKAANGRISDWSLCWCGGGPMSHSTRHCSSVLGPHSIYNAEDVPVESKFLYDSFFSLPSSKRSGIGPKSNRRYPLTLDTFSQHRVLFALKPHHKLSSSLSFETARCPGNLPQKDFSKCRGSSKRYSHMLVMRNDI